MFIHISTLGFGAIQYQESLVILDLPQERVSNLS